MWTKHGDKKPAENARLFAIMGMLKAIKEEQIRELPPSSLTLLAAQTEIIRLICEKEVRRRFDVQEARYRRENDGREAENAYEERFVDG